MQLTKDTRIGELLDTDASCLQVLEQNGMHCFGCPAGRAETLEEACRVHGLNQDALLQQLHAHLLRNRPV